MVEMVSDYGRYATSPTCWAIFLGALAATLCLTPAVIWGAARIGGVEGAGYRKIHQGNVPLLGGLAVAAPFLAVIAWSLTNMTGMFHVIAARRWDLEVLLGGCAAMTALGLVDDLAGIRARHKLVVQILIALLVAASTSAFREVRLPLIGIIELGAPVGTLLTVLWVVGITNAVNLIDGMDGLAAGVSLIAALALGMIAALNGLTFVVLLCLALAGSLLGFFAFNWHPARIFLGDTGSLFLGFALATISLMGSCKSTGGILILGSMMALGIPIFETAISILRRYAGGFPIFSPDSRHTHHRLLRKGLTQRQAAVVFYIGGLFCLVTAVGQTALAARTPESLVPVAIFLAAILGFAGFAGYSRGIVAKFTRRHETRRRIAFSQYGALCLTPECTRQDIQRILALICSELELESVEVRFDRGAARIAGGSAADPNRPHTAKLLIKTADGDPAEVRYRPARPHADDIERHVVEACLARLFDGVSPYLQKEPMPELVESNGMETEDPIPPTNPVKGAASRLRWLPFPSRYNYHVPDTAPVHDGILDATLRVKAVENTSLRELE